MVKLKMERTVGLQPSLPDLRRALIANGYRPVPVNGKRPLIAGWQRLRMQEAQVEGYTHSYADHTNTGLICGEVVAVDIDVPDPVIAAHFAAVATGLPGGERALQRVGKAPKITFVFRSTTVRKKRTTAPYMVNGSKCQVEVLGEGNQFVAFGDHPDTGQPYTWLTPSPLEVPFAELPDIDAATIDAFISDAETILARHGDPMSKPKAAKQPIVVSGDSPWDRVNAAAFANLDAWVPHLRLDRLKRYQSGYLAVASFRASKRAGLATKDRKEALEIQPIGICDHGDGDKGYSPINLVAVCASYDPKDALFWLCEKLGRRPDEFGWGDLSRDDTMRVDISAITGKSKAAPLAANDNVEGTPKPVPTYPSIFDWTSDRYVGPAPAVEYLVDGVVPLGVPCMVAAMGDTGKSFALLELHRRVSFGFNFLEAPVFGGKVVAEGTSVMVTSEDDYKEVHRRMMAVDPHGDRAGPKARKMIVMPLPSAGGACAYWREDRKLGLIETDAFKRLCDELKSIDDLRLITLDPLASFAHLNINEDPSAGQFVCSSLSKLASETGATTFVAHHMRKLAKPIETLGDARESIRGSTALVDGLRLAYAMWPADEKRARGVCKSLGTEFFANRVVLGGVVKANGAAKRIVSTLVRNERGILVDRTSGLGASAPPQEEIISALVITIEAAAESGQPFTKTGATGLWAQKERLPEDLKQISRHRLEAVATTAIERGLIKLCLASGTTTKWLDVPGGQFDLGLGNFRKGGARS